MIKKFIVIACFFFSLIASSQTGSSSPYSYFGIGEARFKGNLENRSMAGLSVEQDSLHINISNPASFAAIRFTAFTIGGNYTTTTLKSDSKSENAQRTSIDYLAVALPLGKVGVGFGLMPYTSVGYNIQNIDLNADAKNSIYKGTGGLNKVFFSMGYTVIPNLIVGADIQYNFGSIQNTNFEYLTGVLIGTQEKNNTNLHGFATNLGVMYKYKINKKTNFYSSLTYSPKAILISNNTNSFSTVSYDSNYNIFPIDAADDKIIKTDMVIPAKLSWGFGVGKTRKWLLGTQLTSQNVGNLVADFNVGENVTYSKASSISLGGFYVPNYNMFSNYFQKIVYRGGLRYSKTGIIIKSEEINETAVNFGMSLPVMGSLSNVNFGLEYGKRGTTNKGLIQENYFTLSMSFSLNDKWFGHRKID